MELGPIGIWAGQFRTGGREAAREAACELDELGYSTLWIPGGGAGDILEVIGDLLEATPSLVLASGILNIWMHEATEVAATMAEFEAGHPGRVLLGLGVSHANLVEASEQVYERPYSVMVEFLDALDGAPTPVLPQQRVLAALGPRMVSLAGERCAGAHPYCVPVAHTEVAREILGEGPLLAPEVKVVLETDPVRARAIARAHLGRYLASPNYRNNLLRLSYRADELDGGGSDAVVDSLVAWGDVEAIAHRVTEHLEAGADHVCLQVLSEDPTRFPRTEWRLLAEALLG